jgi:lysozyme family protein
MTKDLTRNEVFLYLMCLTLCIMVSIFMLKARHQCPLPTATELQTRLVEEGYDITIDGRLGRETTKALDDYHAQKTKD